LKNQCLFFYFFKYIDMIKDINIEEDEREFNISIDKEIDKDTEFNVDIDINSDAIIQDDDEVDKAKVNLGITKRF
jgi:hypothetical protein